jgi:hypothetical protein
MSKSRLVAEYLAGKEAGWQELLGRFTGDSSKSPLERLPTVFDSLELAIRIPDFCGCPFIKALAGYGPERTEPELRARTMAHFDGLEKVVAPLLKQIRPRDSKKLLPALLSLITGTIVVAQATGRRDVASRNKAFARTLLSPR